MKKKGARILVMDDEPEMVRLLQRTFIAHDFQVCTMTNAEDPPEACMQYRPDVLLLGLDGPGSNGLEVCQQLREQSSVPVILLSGNGRECDKVRALALGTDDYVCKPFGQATRATAIACTCSSHSCTARLKQTPIDLA